jgi:signal transduction histidine kinase
MLPQSRLDRWDWIRLLVSILAGSGLSFLLLLLLLNTLLEPQLVAESVLRISRDVRLVEEVLKQMPADQLPNGVLVRERLPFPENEPAKTAEFDLEVVKGLELRQGLVREIRRDRAPLEDPLGGYWIRLQLQNSAKTYWLYRPERLSSLSVWYLPFARTLALLIGMILGIICFLKRYVELPFVRAMKAIPDTEMAPLPLLPEQGIAPLRLLTLRINRLLERLNAVAGDRRLLLRGLAHDFGGPQARLMLQAEALRAQLEGSPRQIADSILEELRQLAAITAQLGLLADQEIPAEIHEPIILDDFCRRLISSYPQSHRLSLDVPRLFILIDLAGLERSLCNLIDNALEYGHPPVVLCAVRQQSMLRIWVDDHGGGFRSSTLMTMPLQPRADDRQRNRHQGLGLVLVDRFCRRQGGRLVLNRLESGGLRAEMLLMPTPYNPLFQAL